MSKFLKQTPRLRDWNAKFKVAATASLRKFGLYKTGALARSVRSVLRESNEGPVFLQYFLFYGAIQENDYPAGHKWGRGRLKRAKKGRPWFTEAYAANEDELIKAIEEDIAEGLYNLISKP